MSTELHIERLGASNFQQFHRLFCQVFGAHYNLAYLRQKYDTAYLGEAYQYLGYLALDEDRQAVGYSGHVPYRLRIAGETLIGAHSCDHMTLAAARGKGIFNQLTKRAEDLVEELGIPLIFGFPNQNNHPLLVKYAGWEIIDHMQVFTFPVTTIPLGSLVRRWPLAEGPFGAWQRFCLRNYPPAQTVSSNGGNGLARDRDFFAHKARKGLHLRQFPSGTVWLKVQGALFIGDVSLEPGASLAQLMSELKRFARGLMVSKLFFMCSSNHPLLKDFRSLAPTTVQGNGIGIKRLSSAHDLNPASLVFTLGDYDTF